MGNKWARISIKVPQRCQEGTLPLAQVPEQVQLAGACHSLGAAASAWHGGTRSSIMACAERRKPDASARLWLMLCIALLERAEMRSPPRALGAGSPRTPVCTRAGAGVHLVSCTHV